MIGIDDKTQSLGSSPSQYKRDILFYDEIILMHADPAIAEWRYGSHSNKKYRGFADEMEYILDTPYFKSAQKLAGIPISGQESKELEAALKEIDGLLHKALPHDSGLTIQLEDFFRLQGLRASLTTRLAAASLSNLGTAAVSVHEMPRIAAGAVTPSLEAGNVIRLAIDRVLIPDERTSWQDILALKQDANLQDRARKLRLWAIQTAKNEKYLSIVEEQLADLLSDYERYLRAHRLKYRTATLGAVITEGAELIEDLLKLRLGKIVGRFFSATKGQAEMMLSEMNAPGRELSIVTQINEFLV